jgi:hypothetical protein
MRAPCRQTEPQSTGDEQRGYGQGQMLCFHCILFFDPSCTFTFASELCAALGKLAFDLERRPGILVRNATGQE